MQYTRFVPIQLTQPHGAWRPSAFLAGLGIVRLLGFVPVVGGLVWVLVTMFGLGVCGRYGSSGTRGPTRRSPGGFADPTGAQTKGRWNWSRAPVGQPGLLGDREATFAS
jgi:hypothetical protein